MSSRLVVRKRRFVDASRVPASVLDTVARFNVKVHLGISAVERWKEKGLKI